MKFLRLSAKRVLLGVSLGLLAVCAGAGISYWKGSSKTMTVHIVSEGFSPEVLTVPKGAAVYFINETDEWHWPASDPHPTHEIYPEFDSHKAIAPNAAWVFSFEKPGGWRYHDHLQPLMTGEIVVQP